MTKLDYILRRAPNNPFKVPITSQARFFTDLNSRFKSGILIGNPGQDISENLTNLYPEKAEQISQAGLDVRYKRLRASENLRGQYILIHIPTTTSEIRFSVKHDLKRIPDSMLIINAIGVSLAPVGLRTLIASLAPHSQKGTNFWTSKRLSLRFKKESADTNDSRFLILVY